MGNLITYLWWGGDPDIPDPYSGLSRRDIYTVQTQWAVIYRKSAEYGMELFLRFFRKDPSTQDYFKIVQGLPEHDIVNKPQFKAHVQILMASLNTAVLNLHSPEVVAALMNKLGTAHRGHRIQNLHFEEFKEVLVDFLVNDLKLDEKSMGSWGRFVGFIYTHIYENLNKK